MQSDEELIESANKGEPEAFEALYYRYRDWVYRLAWRFTADQHLAQDVLQEAFIYLLRKLPGLKLTASMTTFLYPVVKHLSIAARRKFGVTSPELEPDEIPAPASKESEHCRAELAAVLTALPSEQREVLLMRFVDGLTLDEIAKALKIQPSTAKSRLYRALQILRDDSRTREYFLE